DNIGDLGLFALAEKDALDFLNLQFDSAELDRLENKYRKYVRSKVIIRNSKFDLSRKVYTDFFKQIYKVSVIKEPDKPDTDLRDISYDKWIFFTTNYDNILEDFWVKEQRYVYLDLGFELNGKKIMKADKLLSRNVESYSGKSAMQLVKLHGSLNWIINMDNEIKELPLNFGLDDIRPRSGSKDITEELLIYPLTQKELYFPPFIQLFNILGKYLSRRVFWIIIGYSFRDIIIRTMFEKALSEDNRRKLLLVHPKATKLIRPLFKESIQSQVVCLDEYFAKRNYREVNRKIAEALLSLEPTNEQWK
ncbi:MAG: SIR2 family protein, partial [Nitrososphaeraceae archaeon]